MSTDTKAAAEPGADLYEMLSDAWSAVVAAKGWRDTHDHFILDGIVVDHRATPEGTFGEPDPWGIAYAARESWSAEFTEKNVREVIALVAGRWENHHGGSPWDRPATPEWAPHWLAAAREAVALTTVWGHSDRVREARRAGEPEPEEPPSNGTYLWGAPWARGVPERDQIAFEEAVSEKPENFLPALRAIAEAAGWIGSEVKPEPETGPLAEASVPSPLIGGIPGLDDWLA